MRQAGGRGGPAPVCSDPGPTMVKTTAGQRRLPPVPVCSPLPATNELSAGIASSMDNEANVFDEMETRVTAMSSLPPRASVHCSLSSVTRSRHFVRPWLSAHSGIFSSSGWQRRLKARLTPGVLHPPPSGARYYSCRGWPSRRRRHQFLPHPREHTTPFSLAT
ncbi:uncharacterized protein [Miscanthus floridulus]|uniref:uncharacterized protein isoform X3 n=1 Tax=Miscanthus floridulus TaxID=154761 RepID=UPI00345A6C08